VNALQSNQPPDALMLLGTHCPHCPTILQGLGNLLKSGVIGRLEVINIEARPDVASKLGARSVPWVRIGPFELAGLRSENEFREWAQQASSGEGLTAYLKELLSTGEIDKARKLVNEESAGIDALLSAFAEANTPLNTRIGISAIMEDLEGSDLLNGITGRLGELTRHVDARVRGDACHYLTLTGNKAVIPYIEPLLEDPDENVRELAQESIAALD
jgi:hypothetical protein